MKQRREEEFSFEIIPHYSYEEIGTKATVGSK